MERGTHANAPALFQPNIFRPFRGPVWAGGGGGGGGGLISPPPPPPPQQQQQKQQQQEKYIIYGVSRRLMNKFIKHQYWYISFNIW